MNTKAEVILTLHRDGTFDIVAGPVALLRGYPAINHEPVRPLTVVVDATFGSERIEYTLAEGCLRLTFTREAEYLLIGCELSGVAAAPHWLHPIAGARLQGVQRFFRTGVGFSGPTNFVDLSTQPEHFSFESYLITGLQADDHNTLAVSAREVDVYMQQSHVDNRLHHRQFRNREIDRNVAYFEAGFSTEEIPLPNGRLSLPTLYFSTDVTSWQVLRRVATDVAQAAMARVGRPAYHYCSFYRRGPYFTQHDLDELLDGLAVHPQPLQAIQLDDGYCPGYGDWLEPHATRFPDGLQHAFRRIAEAGYTPGVWVGPFMVSNRSRLAAQHPDWLLHWADGTRIVGWRCYNGALEQEEVFVLDSSHPAAMAYLAQVFRTLHDWGARFFKTDFIEWGWKDSTRVRRHTPGKTSTQYYCDVLRTIRESIGEESYWLGCIAYFAPSIGFVDGMRVSSDVGISWDGEGGIGNDGCGGGTQNMLEESYGCQYFNNVLWQNDPDVTFLRDYYIDMSADEMRALACWNGILGVSINTSDDFHRLPADRLRLWEFMRPQLTPWTARLPYWEGGSQFKVAVREYPTLKSWAVVILNDRHETRTERLSLHDWIGQPTAHVFRWGPEGALPLGEQHEWIAEIPTRHATVLYLSTDGAPPPATLSIGGWMG